MCDQLSSRFHHLQRGSMTVAFNRDTFTEPEWSYHEVKHTESEITGLLIGWAKFRRPTGGVERFTAASLHLHHTQPKKDQTLQPVTLLTYVRSAKSMMFKSLVPTSIKRATMAVLTRYSTNTMFPKARRAHSGVLRLCRLKTGTASASCCYQNFSTKDGS